MFFCFLLCDFHKKCAITFYISKYCKRRYLYKISRDNISMFLCFVDESGNFLLEDQTDKFFVLCSLQIKDSDIIRFEERISELLENYGLPMKGNLKKIRRATHDYEPFNRFGVKKKQNFYTDLYTVLNESPAKLIASVINKEILRSKYLYPDPPLERAYKHLLERINYFLSKTGDTGMIIFDENYEKDKKKTLVLENLWD